MKIEIIKTFGKHHTIGWWITANVGVEFVRYNQYDKGVGYHIIIGLLLWKLVIVLK